MEVSCDVHLERCMCCFIASDNQLPDQILISYNLCKLPFTVYQYKLPFTVYQYNTSTTLLVKQVMYVCI